MAHARGREALRAARLAAGMTQQAVADELGVGVRYYQDIEAGRKCGSFSVWDKLEDLFSVHQRELRRTGRAASQS